MPFKPGVSSHIELEGVEPNQHHKWPLEAADVGAATPADVAAAQQAAQDYTDQAVGAITPETIGAATPADVAAAEQAAKDYAETIVPEVPPASSGTEAGTVPVTDYRGAIPGFAPAGAGFYVPFTRRGFLTIPDRVTCMAFQGSYLYVGYGGTTQRGVRVIDLFDPSDPKEVGALDYNTPGEIVPRGRYLYVSTRYASFILDVSVPTSPAVVGIHSDETGYAVGLALWGNRYYANHFIVGIDDPAHPLTLGEFPDLQGIGKPSWYAARDKLVFGVASRTDDVAGNVQAWDVSDPAEPVLLNVWEDDDLAPAPASPVLSGNLLIVAGEGYYAAPDIWQQRLLVFDVSNPANITLLGYASQPLGWYGMNQIRVQGNYVYGYSDANDVATGYDHSALFVWDIENPRAPSLARIFELSQAPSGAAMNALAIQGSLLAASYYNGSSHQIDIYG